jgi:hypothetical protein
MVLGSTQPLTEMTTRNLPWGKGRPVRKADLTAICEPIFYKKWKFRRLTTLWASMAYYRDSFNFFTILWDVFVISDRSSPTFRMKVLLPSSRLKSLPRTNHPAEIFWLSVVGSLAYFSTVKTEELGSSETSAHFYHSTRCHNTEEVRTRVIYYRYEHNYLFLTKFAANIQHKFHR